MLDQAVAAAAADYVARNPQSLAQHERAAAAMPGGNTRTSLFHDPFPLCMVQGEGARLTDADGHGYVDFLGEFTAGIFGHSPAPLKRAITDALAAGINLSSHNRLEAELAALICARFPSMDMLRFTNSGTEANLMALAAAIAHTGRRKVVVFEGGYHGGVLVFPPGGSPVTVPHQFVMVPYNDAAAARAAIDGDTAAILVEPMLGAGGCLPGTPEFLGTLRQAATETGAVLIFDEIQTSRLSVGGQQAVLGITPDMTTIGKFFGGGLAFGCFGGRRDIMGVFDPRRPGALMHAGTFNNNTLTMAAGIAAAGLLTAEALDAVNARGERFRADLNALFERRQAPFHVTGLGSLMNVHMRGDPGLRKLMFFDLLRDGIYFAQRGLIALSFAITVDDTAAFLAATDRFATDRRALWS